MNTAAITIQGVQFTVPQPYSAGHEINEGEAHALNQVMAENIRNNFSAQIKSAKEEGKTIGQAELDAYVANYKFGVRSGGVRVDPVTAEMNRLAKAGVIAAIKAKNIDVKSVPKEHLAKLVEQAAPRFRAKAEAIVAERKSAVESLDDLDLGVAA